MRRLREVERRMVWPIDITMTRGPWAPVPRALIPGALIAVSLSVIPPALGQTAPAAPPPAAPPQSATGQTGIAAQTGSDAPEARALREVDTKMHAGMTSVRHSGDADRDFVASMIPHHQGAIDMATIELQFGKDDDTRRMAERIIEAQQKEIAEMNAWLAKHPAPVR
jgi:hypothetical protein